MCPQGCFLGLTEEGRFTLKLEGILPWAGIRDYTKRKKRVEHHHSCLFSVWLPTECDRPPQDPGITPPQPWWTTVPQTVSQNKPFLL